jgi:hypothetical protein
MAVAIPIRTSAAHPEQPGENSRRFLAQFIDQFPVHLFARNLYQTW